MQCKFGYPPANDHTVCLHLDQFGASTDRASCMKCPMYEGMSRGIGDTIARLIQTVVPKEIATKCGGCAARQQSLNEAFPYADKEQHGDHTHGK